MRISDWSSDVCSSDLTLSRRHCGCAFTKARNSALVTGRLCSSNGATSTLRTYSYLSAERKLPPGSWTPLLPAAASAAGREGVGWGKRVSVGGDRGGTGSHTNKKKKNKASCKRT